MDIVCKSILSTTVEIYKSLSILENEYKRVDLQQ